MCVCSFSHIHEILPGSLPPPPFTVRGRARHNNNAEEEEEEGAKNENMQAEEGGGGEGEDLPQRGGVKKVVDSGGCVLRGGYPPTWTGISSSPPHKSRGASYVDPKG